MIKIELNKTHYFPTNIIEGAIKLKISELTLVKSLKLRFYKKQKILLKKIDGLSPEIIIDEDKIIRESIHDFCQNCELSSGEHTFPFKIKLKHEENGTGKIKGYFYDSVCQVENFCILEGICSTNNNDYHSEKLISIYDKNEEKRQTDLNIKTHTFLCLFDKTILYRILLDKVWYTKGDNIAVECFSVTKTSKPVIAGISGKLYQLVIINRPGNNIIKAKQMCTSNGFPSNRNRFKIQFRIPMNAGPSITEAAFTVRTVLFLEIKLYSGSILKIKKYLNIGEPFFEIPEIESKSIETGKVFSEVFIDY